MLQTLNFLLQRVNFQQIVFKQMEEQLNSLAVTHLLQHTLRSLCIHENSQWVYAVFWRILPRNYPPPKWDSQGGVYDRSRGNRRNWILVWEDGFCNFAASTTTTEMNAADCSGSSVYGNYEYNQHYQGLQPELFFKMSHEIYNYGEGLVGKVAADHSHKWIYKEPNDQEINFLSAWHNSADSHPRTWEAQFQSGIKTIALIAVREGVIQLGSVHKVIEDLSYVVLLRKKLSYIESIPGVLLPHPSSVPYPSFNTYNSNSIPPQEAWHNFQHMAQNDHHPVYDHFAPHPTHPIKITPSMSSLEALLSKLPSVGPVQPSTPHVETRSHDYLSIGPEKVAKEELGNEEEEEEDIGTSSSLVSPYDHHQHYAYHHDLNVSSSMSNNGCN